MRRAFNDVVLYLCLQAGAATPRRGSTPTLSLDEGSVTYASAEGKRLGIQWSDNPLELGVLRNGKPRNLSEDARHLYRSPMIRSAWRSGILEVKAGGRSFRCQVDAANGARFEHSSP